MSRFGKRLAAIELSRHHPEMILVRRALFEEMDPARLEQYRADVRRVMANPRGTVLIFGDALEALFPNDPPELVGPTIKIERGYWQ